ncbi:MAG TPA: peptidase C69, partial [Massilia sp.]|nr:peptidase C69 [Massilia sp.]
MKQLNQEEAKRICDRVLSFSKADECSVDISGNRSGNVRFARNSISTAGLNEDMVLTVQVAFGKKSGIAQVNEFDDKSLEKAVRRAEELARLAPENPEFMPAIGKQQYKPTPTFVRATADIDPEFRAQVAAYSIEAAKKAGLVTAGFFNDNTRFNAIANSNGVFGFQELTDLTYTCTARTEDGRGSGWVSRAAVDARRFDAREAVGVAIEKALRSVDAKA